MERSCSDTLLWQVYGQSITTGTETQEKNRPQYRIREETLDAAVVEYIDGIRKARMEESEHLAELQKIWALRKPILDARIVALENQICRLEAEIDEIVMEKIRMS